MKFVYLVTIVQGVSVDWDPKIRCRCYPKHVFII